MTDCKSGCIFYFSITLNCIIQWFILSFGVNEIHLRFFPQKLELCHHSVLLVY